MYVSLLGEGWEQLNKHIQFVGIERMFKLLWY